MHSGVTDYFYKEDHITFYEQHLFTASNGKKKKKRRFSTLAFSSVAITAVNLDHKHIEIDGGIVSRKLLFFKSE